MPDDTNDIDALLAWLDVTASLGGPEESRRYHAALSALVAERDSLRANLAAAIKERDGLLQALEEIANQDYRGNRSNESLIAQRALAATRKEGGGA